MKTGGSLSIWFFVGISLAVNGVLILAAGLYELSHPPLVPVVLYSVHANVWWGALLAVAGTLATYRFRPRKQA